MEDIHSLLRRQIRKYFGEWVPPLQEWREFIEAVNRAYREFDEDRSMLERSLDLSSQELLHANAEMRAVFEAFPDLFYRLDNEGKILDYKGGKASGLYFRPEKVIGKRIQDIAPKEIGSKFQEAIDELRNTESIVNMEYSLQVREEEHFYEARLLPLIEGQIIVIVRNITNRKIAEEALAAEKERLAVTLRSIGDGVIATDISGKVLMLNEVAEKLTGWRQREAFGKPVLQVFNIIDKTTRRVAENPVQKVLEGGSTVRLSDNTALVARDGTERIIANSGSAIKDKEGGTIGVVLVFRDITEKRKMKNELQRSQKLESIGVLAGGIAHDFNNILVGIVGSISLAKMGTDKNHKNYKLLNEAEDAAFKARDLTGQLLTFSKGGMPIKETAGIKEFFEASVGFALRGSNVGCIFDLPDDLWAVDIDRGQINQVISNLVINAGQAMPEGGNITIRARNISRVNRDESIPLKEDMAYVKISIQDEGMGIPDKTLSRIFDPYFTTKQKGSGLGLAISFSIISRHGGFITVESKLGVGTTVHIYLPASEKIPESANVSEKLYEGRGRMLVMDDDRLIRDVFRGALGSIGYEVDCACDGWKHRSSSTPIPPI